MDFYGLDYNYPFIVKSVFNNYIITAMTKVYKVNIKNDVEFKEFIEKQGYRFLYNSVLKNCFAGENYYWLDDWNNVKYYGLLLETLVNQKDIVTNEPVYEIINY